MNSAQPAATRDRVFVLNASHVVITTRDERCSVDINNPIDHSMPSNVDDTVCTVNIPSILNKATVSHFRNTFKLR